jgi:hypothetical protein
VRALKIIFALHADFVGFVLGRIIEDKNLLDSIAQVGRDAMQCLPQRRFGVVSDHQDSDAGISHVQSAKRLIIEHVD